MSNSSKKPQGSKKDRPPPPSPYAQRQEDPPSHPHGRPRGHPPPSPYAQSEMAPPSHPHSRPRAPPQPSPFAQSEMAPPSRRGPSSSQPATRPGKAKDTASRMATGNVIGPSALESETAVTKSFSGMTLGVSTGATVSPFQNEDPRYKPKPGDITYMEPPPFFHPPPSEQSQPHPSAQSRRGASSSQRDTHPNPTEQSQPHTSGRAQGGHKPPSPPEKAGQAKRRKRTTTSEVTSSLQEEEAPEGDYTLLGEPPVPSSWWTEKEDEALRRIKPKVPLLKNKGVDWETISRKLKEEGIDRSADGCSKQWRKSPAESLSRGRAPKWTKAEDDRLNELVSEIGFIPTKADWERISAEVSLLGVSRPPAGCRIRYTELERQRKQRMHPYI